MKKRLPSEERKWLQYYNGVKDEDDFSEYSLYEAIHHVDDESRKALSFLEYQSHIKSCMSILI